MKIILSNNQILLIDKKDWLVYGALHWYGGKYPSTKVDGKTTYLHRLILNAPYGLEVDHINGDGMDNRRHNLRLVNRWQNEANKDKPSHNTSGYKGVSRYLKNKIRPWTAYIEYDKKIHLGYFATKEEAAHVYNQFAEQLFGQYARLNKIGG